MCIELINHSSDLSKLRDEGFQIRIQSDLLVIQNVPYVNDKCQVKFGTLISTLNLSGDRTERPADHVVHFAGEYPCNKDGNPLTKIVNGEGINDWGGGLSSNYTFSSKPQSGYQDYYDKMTAYFYMLSNPAEALDPSIMEKSIIGREEKDSDSPFEYRDVASSRVCISAIVEKLNAEKIAIIGLGGTGSYVLDFIAKTPVKEIHLFDDDTFLQHNAFRAPGAASLEDLRSLYTKVDYLHKIYSSMHRHIFTHATKINATNVDILKEMTFVFICADNGEAKKPIMEYLESEGISFIDVGMGLSINNDSKIVGTVRTTTSTNAMRECAWNNIPLSKPDQDNAYGTNIQIADLNALNAVLAVIKWKKILGVYLDLEEEYNSVYTIDGNILGNEWQVCAD